MLPKLIAHMDLKGVQRRPDYCLRHLETLQSLGYDGLLMEYEDVFPYGTASFSASPGEIWSREYLSHFLEKAAACGLEVIPLQQSLGHLEYALRWDRYREHGIFNPTCNEPIELSTLAIDRRESREWLKALLREIIAAHPESKFVHLGMDEAWPLTVYARESGNDPLALFLEWLEELCGICSEAGRMPLIWSDMLEDHLNPENLDRLRALRDRVVLVHWNYTANAQPLTEVRFAGWRTSRHWRENPRIADSANLRKNLLWMEDWPLEIAALAKEFRAGDHGMESLFQAAVWKRLGFRVLGTCAAAIMKEGPLVSRYHQRMDNIDRWKEGAASWDLEGLIVSAWARGGTFYPPTVFPDLHLPMLEYASGRGDLVFQGVPRERLWRLLAALGRCSENWGIVDDVVREMEEIAPSLTSHAYEWKTLTLMARMLP